MVPWTQFCWGTKESRTNSIQRSSLPLLLLFRSHSLLTLDLLCRFPFHRPFPWFVCLVSDHMIPLAGLKETLTDRYLKNSWGKSMHQQTNSRFWLFMSLGLQQHGFFWHRNCSDSTKRAAAAWELLLYVSWRQTELYPGSFITNSYYNLTVINILKLGSHRCSTLFHTIPFTLEEPSFLSWLPSVHPSILEGFFKSDTKHQAGSSRCLRLRVACKSLG